MRNPKIGLLPFYIELYDRVLPKLLERMERFLHAVADELKKRGMDVLPAPICRLRQEFEDALLAFERGGADAVFTLHLAYSPSLESADALAATKLPVVVLDTTETWDFGFGQSGDEILYNHGVHGVQDMCNMMKRNGKSFEIVAGHWQRSDALDRAAVMARSAMIASDIRHARVGVVGGSFEGMGDFLVPEEELMEFIGIQTLHLQDHDAERLFESISDEEIQSEMESDKNLYHVRIKDETTWRLATKAGLALRKWTEREALTAVTVNFLATVNGTGLSCMPFLEASKAMVRGLGYAGEGDGLTAALVGALSSTFAEVSFTEMFCPDWKSGSVFLSHMGEMNLCLARDKPLLMDTESPFVGTGTAVAAYGCFKPGKAAIVNLAPGREGFSLIVANGEMLDTNSSDSMKASVRGWFHPDKKLPEFLEEYSRAGGIHHSALVYGYHINEIAGFGRIMGWKVVEM